jgi:ABC-type nitrate/sulfonate/bicarbonate transport system substrate-binding protein
LFDLVNDSSVDLASNAETQSLRNYANHKNLRIIYTIAEVGYRIVADKRRIPAATSLKGKRKRIGVMAKTSSEYFVEKFMASSHVDARKGEYELVNGKFCNVEPCGNDTLPELLKRGEIDAVGFWEPTVELSARAIGKEEYAIFFSDFAVYREIYSLHSTAETLANPEKRKEIVEFVRALEKSLKVFREEPDKVIPRAAQAVGLGKAGEELLKAVWDHHRWSGDLPSDLYTVLVEEDKYTARVDNRTETGGESLKGLIDGSILKEARAGIA